MRKVLAGKLWQGNRREACQVGELLGYGIRAVIDLADADPPLVYPRDIAYFRIPMMDGMGNNPAILRLALQLTAAVVAEGLPTLIFCAAGMSRSVCLASFAKALADGTEPEAGLLALYQDGPCDVTPGLWTELQAAWTAFHR